MSASVKAPPAAGVRRTRRHQWRWALVPLIVVALYALLALFAPLIAPHDPKAQDLFSIFTPPVGFAGGAANHLLGTDEIGRDILSNIIYGIRVSMLVGFAAVLISLVIGVPLGLWAGFAGGRVDAFIMRLADIQLSLPSVLLALAVLAIFGAGLVKLIIVIGVVGWAPFARIVRGSVLVQRELDYVAAGHALGLSDRRILFRHILPNILGPIIVQATVDFPANILLEATLSFLGLGAGIDTPSLGLMVARGYQYLYSGSWWPSILPGFVIVVLVYATNTLGDRLRDKLDPRLRH